MGRASESNPAFARATTPVGARLARESDLTANIYAGCDDLFAGKPRSYS
ncbi:hypothetical protein C4K26_5807 [Pseudomonas chlororaphis]|nr:hypothetical protein C4K26_5807 [Pseudomonas chlororaphis]